MRVLVVPEFYRPDATANGTVNDAVAWIREWLTRDETLHVYLLAPPHETAGDDPTVLLADRDRVTLVKADPPFAAFDDRAPFTETGYAAAQLRALDREIHDPGAYVDVVVDQLRSGRETLYKFLLDETDQWASDVRPFDVVANVHDFQIPRKYRYCSYRNHFQFRLEAASVAFADGAWFTAGVDRTAFADQVDFLAADVVEETVANSVVAGSPIEFDRFEETYADDPRWLHLAGSLWAKKNVDRLFDVATALHDRYGIRTLLTSVEPIPERYREPAWVEAHGEASRETYEDALERGDIAVIASDYETMARTPFEQAASGQVLVLRDAPWTRECTPDDHPMLAPVDELADRAVAAVADWDSAVAANRELVAHARELRGPTACGRRTYRDLRRRVAEKTEQYAGGKQPDVVEQTVADCDDRFTLTELAERTATHTDSGRPLPDHESYARTDLRYTLRALGFTDTGEPGTPVFERA